MPKSKRDKIVTLPKTKKKGRQHKVTLVEKIQECVDKFERVFVVSARNLQNALAEELREAWAHSRFFFGKNTVMARALGCNRESEYKRNLHKMSLRLHGPTGLLFTNSSEEEVLKWFSEFKKETSASVGDVAPLTIELNAGPLKMFQHTMEPHLRKLGLPTKLDSGIISLLADYEVCHDGKELTVPQAKILRLLGHKLYTFQVTVECMWSNEKYKAFTVAQETAPVKEIQFKKGKAKASKEGDKKDDKVDKKGDKVDDEDDEEVEMVSEDEDDD